MANTTKTTKTILDTGAEAVIEKHKGNEGSYIVKKRVVKSYRHPLLDKSLRQFRTRREAKILQTLQTLGFPAPQLKQVDDQETEINMQYIEGDKVKDILEENHVLYSREIGKRVAELHMRDIIHGDLTTSNMIRCKETQKIHFIDFGLGKISDKIEDKAVDLHLLERALESKHHQIFKECFENVKIAYAETNPQHQLVFERYEKVRARGRNKAK